MVLQGQDKPRGWSGGEEDEGNGAEKYLGWVTDGPWGFRGGEVLRRTPESLAWSR